MTVQDRSTMPTRGTIVADGVQASDLSDVEARPDWPAENMPGVVVALLAGLLYFIACRVGFWQIVQPERITPIWPASGVGLALMALSQPRQWKWILLGIAPALVLANIGLSRPIPMVASFTLANLAETLLGAIVLTRFGRDRVDFSSMRHFTRLLLVVGPVTALTACIAALVAPLGYVPRFIDFWSLWATSDGLGILIVTPLVLSFSRNSLRWPGLFRAAEAAFLTASAVAVAWLVIWNDTPWHHHLVKFPFLLSIPLLLWASLRLGVTGTAVVSLLLTVTSFVGIVRGHRPYMLQGLSVQELYLTAQIVVMGRTACALVIAIAISQNRRVLEGIKREKALLRLSETQLMNSRRELIEANQFNRKVIASVQDGVIVMDREMRYRVWNANMEELSGLKESEVIGRRAVEVFPFLKEAGLVDMFDRALAGETVSSPDFRYEVPGTGKTGWNWQLMGPLRSADGQINGVIATVRDITDRRRAEEELRQRETAIRRLDRINILGQMAGGLAHELSQPLAAIFNYSSSSVGMVRDNGATGEQVLSALEAITAEARRARDIIGWLQSFIRKQEPARTPLNVNAQVRHAVELMRHDLNQARIVVKLDLAEPLPPAVGGSVQVDQVLVNLIRNAIDAMQAPGATGSGLTVRSCADGNFVRVDVTDLGCGLSPDRVGSMFEPFFTTKQDGIGMGLAVSRAIVIDCGGELTASHGPQGGMTMSFTLPAESAGSCKGNRQ